MKRLIVLLALFFAPYLSANLNDFYKSNDKNGCSLLLLVTDSENNHYLASFKVSDLKLCDYPKGPLRNNEVTCNDFSKVSQGFVEQAQELIKQEQAIELKNFCMDDLTVNDNKHKTCLFEVDSNKFCYAFRVIDYPINAMQGIILNDIYLEKLYEMDDNADVDDEDIDDLDDVVIKPQPDIPPSPRYKVLLKEIGVWFILKFFETQESAQKKYSSIKQYLKEHICGK